MKKYLFTIYLLTSMFSVSMALDSFETIPANWNTYAGGSISTSPDHYKDGANSLRWDFVNGSYLMAENPANLHTAGTNNSGGIIIWVYNETPIDANITLMFGDHDEILNETCKYKIDFGLNFTGWRCGWIRLQEDAVNPSWTKNYSMDWFGIKAPSSQTGTVFLDMVDFVDVVTWYRTRDHQLPHINPSSQLSFHHWQHTQKWSVQQPQDLPPEEITLNQINDFAAVKQRYEDFLLGENIENSTNIIEHFDTDTTVTIDNSGSSNELTQLSQSSGFRWGGYNAGSSGNIMLESQTDNRLRFRLAANTSGSYAYTIFDASGGTDNPQQNKTESISCSAVGSGLEGTEIRFMVRSAADLTWYCSEAIAAQENQAVNVESLQWYAVHPASNYQLNQLAPRDEAPLNISQTISGGFSELVGEFIDGGGVYIENGTQSYYNINSIEWGTVDIVSRRMNSIQNFISNGVSQYENFTITRTGSGIKGTPLFNRNSAYSPKVGEEFAETVMLALALDYRINANGESKDKFLLCLDHLHDQGWAQGSSMGSLSFQMNQEAGWVNSIFLMWDAMSEHQKQYSWNALDWYCEFGEVYKKPYFRGGTTADRFQCIEIPRLLRILLMPDTPEKVRDMHNYIEWLSNAYGTAYGWSGTIKPDYTGWHHLGIQANAYAPAAFHAGAAVIYMLSGSEFAVKDDAVKNIENALAAYSIYLNKYDMNTGIGGKMAADGTDDLVSVLPAYAYLAAADGDTANSRFAAIFKRLYDMYHPGVLSEMTSSATTAGKMWVRTLGSNKIVQQIAESNAEAEETPSGTFNYNCSALLAHRRSDWLASVKGWSKYVLNYETPGTNELGWNQSSGCLQILTPQGKTASGIDLDSGWDWNRYPGNTAVNISYSDLAAKPDRMFTKEGFVGGTNLDNQDGLFAMKLRDNLSGIDLKADKTYFFFDDVIVCLGTGISEANGAGNVETTLFQGRLAEKDKPVYDNSTSPVTAFPYSSDYTDNETWLMDAFGNGYYIPSGQTVHLRKYTQTTMNKTAAGTSAADFAAAWLEHGTGPSGQSYEYAVKVQTSPNEMLAFAEAPTYQVMQKDGNAHVVQDKITKTTGYAVFAADQSFSAGDVKHAASPSLILTRRDGPNRLNLSICDPDLHIDDGGNPGQDTCSVKQEHIYYNKSQQSSVNITLRGKWQLNRSCGIKESFDAETDVEIDAGGPANEQPKTSPATGYTWGGYNAADSGNVHFDTQFGGRLRFRLAANTQGSYAYTIFKDSSGLHNTVKPKSVSFTCGARGLEGTYIRVMLRNSTSLKWYISKPLKAEDFVVLNLHQTLWAEIDSDAAQNLNRLAAADEKALTFSGNFEYYQDSLGENIDAAGFYIETGTNDYFAIDEIVWSRFEDGLFAGITDSSLLQTAIEAQCYYGKVMNLDLVRNINLPDYANFARQWLKQDCGECDGADLNTDNKVGIHDLIILTSGWLYNR
ncbi:Chondroitin sulfate ABC exolyase precursor [Limihaloglobus sulfuriphilus]|uniref:Chondroitin sulfate ABC exolyase n=1 Tax=Limihaloglobus sulfuriphilus TaxID=1851148 RepID=A0A1Q2MED2_9BACT|nr:chondroitinase family polysaccharide lyase [Limihaloglobus sulfuriphilus]AQQ71061.1 Chondroitin sulfate ABC exolyase precursor [Limihaloglobus sulfuriphilus]